MAALHAAAFTAERPWSAQEFQELLASPFVAVIARAGGFALTRSLAGESELLTLAVDPAQQRRGIGRDLLRDWLAAAQCGGIEDAFLEVAADNAGAIALYQAAGFAETGRRRGYYARAGAASVDALLMGRALTRGQPIGF